MAIKVIEKKVAEIPGWHTEVYNPIKSGEILSSLELLELREEIVI